MVRNLRLLRRHGAERQGEIRTAARCGIRAQRGEVELHLGAPVQTVALENGRRADVYQYQIGNQPSAGRAIGTA